MVLSMPRYNIGSRVCLQGVLRQNFIFLDLYEKYEIPPLFDG